MSTPGRNKHKRQILSFHPFSTFTGIVGGITGLLFLPPVFNPLFSMGPGLEQTSSTLLSLSAILILASAALLILNLPRKPETALVFFCLLILFGVELSTRLFVTLFRSQGKQELLKYSLVTWPGYQRMTGHPFLQYVGNRTFNSDYLDPDTPPYYNKYGFRGPDYDYAKPEGVIRVACLGGSTTHSGYPALLEEYLNRETPDTSNRFEVMNFGMSGYTTAHSLVNYLLNVREFEPDYLVIHHAWNEIYVRDAGDRFTTDYSHELLCFQSPKIPAHERFLYRTSVFYRYLLHKFEIRPGWMDLFRAMRAGWPPKGPPELNDLEELLPYRRNLDTIIREADHQGTKVILTTMPHSTDPSVRWYEDYRQIEQCNPIIRELYEIYSGRVHLVDLDSLMTGGDMFKDVAHMTNKGKMLKAAHIGSIILKNCE